MQNFIDLTNLEKLCRGASFLGSGGGGDTNELSPLVKQAIEKFGPVPLLTMGELRDDDYVIAIELIGAPIPKGERNFPQQPNFRGVFELAQRDLGRSIKALMPVEIGGSNALAPLCIAGEVGLPLLDGDLLGRALPLIPMISTNVFGMMPSRAYISDPLTGECNILNVSTYEELEKAARLQAQKHKSTSAVLIPVVLTGIQVRKAVISGTVNLAISIGQAKTVLEICSAINGEVRFEGRVTDWRYTVERGFLVGSLCMQTESGEPFEIEVKNEYMKLRQNGQELAKAPEIITLLDKRTLCSIQSDQIEPGCQIICITCPGPELWRSGKGLALIEEFWNP